MPLATSVLKEHIPTTEMLNVIWKKEEFQYSTTTLPISLVNPNG